ncbi:MAG: hypothetical protein K8R46_02505 [Pirellulales bacterium]|nr:hypothetical protein [Pirellulales bacterium]
MYANLGPGHTIELDPPSPNGVDLLYSHEYVAERMRERNFYGYCDNNPMNKIDPTGLAAQCPDECDDGKENDGIPKDVLKELENVTDVVGLINTILKNAKVFSKPGAIGGLRSMIGNPGSTMKDALTLFATPNSPCNLWLKGTLSALAKAGSGDGSGCSSIAAQMPGNSGNSAGDRCSQDLATIPVGGTSAAMLFSNRANAWAEKCKRIAAKNKKGEDNDCPPKE